MLSTRQMDFNLRDWTDDDFRQISAYEKKIKQVGHNAGAGSDKFITACRDLLTCVITGSPANIEQAITTITHVRAFAYLLVNSAEFISKVKINYALLIHLTSIRSPLSRLTLTQLIRAFLTQFDKVASTEQLENWCKFIKYQLSQLDTSKGSSDLKIHANYANEIFSIDGPEKIVERASGEKVDFETIVKKLALNGYTDGRYLTLSRYYYYLETLEAINIGEDHPILQEVCKKDVINAPYKENRLLGHAILEILIDRSQGSQISQSWQNTILTIAGDPRVPKSHSNFQQWWALLGEKRIALMRAWLSRFDLKLFLKILEQSAEDGYNSDMRRMFKDRKIFMEGLESQGLVAESRLFLSRYAEQYLRRHYKKEELPNFARVESSETSMIYLNIAGSIHMIEGSHSFKLKLMDKLPSGSKVNNYSVTSVSDHSLRTYIELQYRNEFVGHNGITAITHHPPLNWQNKAINFLKKHNVKVTISEVIPQENYREYKQKFGVY